MPALSQILQLALAWRATNKDRGVQDTIFVAPLRFGG